MPEEHGASIPETADLAIVGGGIAGLYCAWRYLQENPGDSVVVLERLNRPGGRLQTDLVDLDSGGEPVTVRDEEGGMRFNYGMGELMALFHSLGLCDEIVPFPMVGANNRYLFRGRAFTYEESSRNPQVWSQLYGLAPEEQNRLPVDLLGEAYHRVLKANGVDEAPAEPTPEFWQTLRLEYTWDGTPLYRWQLWGLLRAMGYTEECCTMLAHSLGFEGPFWSTMNAGEAFQLMEDFPQDPTYFTFEKGYGVLIDAIVQRVEAAGGRIFLSANVDAVAGHEGGGFELQVTQAPEYVSASPFVPGGTKAAIRAPRVVLALPRLALQTLFATSPVLNHRHSEDRAKQERAQQLWEDLLTTTNQRLLKVNLYFERSWWQELDLPVQYGPSFTDLPVNAVYPFYSLRGVHQDRTDTAPPPASLPAALTIYCDWDNTNFWQGLQSVGEPFDSPEQRKHGEEKPQTLFPASRAVVEEALRLFAQLYNTREIPQPILTSFRLWDDESDFGYAVHQWGLDARDDGVIERLVQPFEGIYTCNEAYSDMQGWVNGSLRSADLVLQTLGISPLVDGGKQCMDTWNRDPAAAAPEHRMQAGGLWGRGVQALRPRP